MTEKYEKIVKWLFSTKAIQVAQPDQPFWYTSGKLGPYYINTHYLYGDQQSANLLLEFIENGLKSPLILPEKLAIRTQEQYKTNSIYKSLMDMVAESISKYNFDIISGGERRDFFFSIQAASILNKPHLSILKDGRSMISGKGFSNTKWAVQSDLNEMKVLHIADLVTEASSYIRTWIPTVKSLGCIMEHTLSVVDRKQGGARALASEGVKLDSLVSIDKSLFEKAVENNLMTTDQQEQILLFMEDPNTFMQTFLINNPEFLDSQLNAGGKSAERAKLCLELGYGTQD